MENEGKNMKSILYSVCIGTLALALAAGGAQAATDKDKRSERAKTQQRSAEVQAARPRNTGRSMAAHRNVSAVQSRQRSYAKPRTSSTVNPASAGPTTIRQRNLARNERMRERNSQRKQEFRAQRDVAVNRDRNLADRTRNADVRARNDAAINRERNLAANRARNIEVNRNRNAEQFRPRNNNVDVNRERNVAVNRTRNGEVNRNRNANEFRGRNDVAINRNRNGTVNRTQNAAYYRGGNVRVTNNWRGDAFRGQQYTVFRNYNKQWHERSGWRSHYTRIIFVNSGWWYWNAGYWFPAWGYAPYVSFVFDGPIYAYNGLSPDQVTVNVQEA